MSEKTIGLVHPPLHSFPSGGNVYNAKLLEFAARDGFPLLSLPWQEKTLPPGHCDLRVWDSLLLSRLTRIKGECTAVLLHYLPSMDPTLGPGERLAAQGMEDVAMAKVDFAIATGESVAHALAARWPPVPVFVCEPGVAEVFQSKQLRPPNQTVALLTVAHVMPAKGHGPLMEILGRLRTLPWHWHVVGDCDRSPETMRDLRQCAARTDLTDRITFHGALPQEAVASLMASSDLLVAPSTFEAYGMAVAEALASGLPVLCKRVGAAEKLVRHGVTGFLTTPGDWNDFGDHLKHLLEDASLRAGFAANLGQKSTRGWDRTAESFRAACQKMLGANQVAEANPPRRFIGSR